MKPFASMLFVPAHKRDWIHKAPRFEADALILDLEDATPLRLKGQARAVASEAIGELGTQGHSIFVRINAASTGLLDDDLVATVRPGLAGVVLPKVGSPDEVAAAAEMIGALEGRAGLAELSVAIILLPEEPAGILHAETLALASGRVRAIATGTIGQGDVARAIGFRETAEGIETVYLLSHLQLSARAAGVRDTFVIGSTRLDPEGLPAHRRTLERAYAIGYTGAMVIHPSHVALANDVFKPTTHELEEARQIVERFAEAEEAGNAAVRFGGGMIDTAHVRTALELLDRAEVLGLDVGVYPRPHLTLGNDGPESQRGER